MGLEIDWCVCGILGLWGNKVNFEIMKDIGFTIIASCALTRSIIEMLIHLKVDETKWKCGQSAHGVIKHCIGTNCSH